MTMKREQHKYVTEKFSNLGKILLGMEGGGGQSTVTKATGRGSEKETQRETERDCARDSETEKVHWRDRAFQRETSEEMI